MGMTASFIGSSVSFSWNFCASVLLERTLRSLGGRSSKKYVMVCLQCSAGTLASIYSAPVLRHWLPYRPVLTHVYRKAKESATIYLGYDGQTQDLPPHPQTHRCYVLPRLNRRKAPAHPGWDKCSPEKPRFLYSTVCKQTKKENRSPMSKYLAFIYLHF